MKHFLVASIATAVIVVVAIVLFDPPDPLRPWRFWLACLLLASSLGLIWGGVLRRRKPGGPP
jgi:hypothetical protein